MAYNPFAHDVWTRARDRFAEDLSEPERSMYHQSSLEMILYDASAAQKRHQDTSNSRNFVSKLQPFTSAIDQYGEALDVYANAYPLALSPLWGSLRVVLFLAREFGKYFDKLVDIFERIGDVLPRFREYERLFPNHERLVHLLSVVYVDILKFCSDVKAVFRRGKRPSIVNLKIFSKLVWKSFEQQFGNVLERFREQKQKVEKEAELSHMIESADSRAIMLANRLQLGKEKREDDRSRMLSQLSAVSHEDLHKRQRHYCHIGTGLWVLQNRDYIKWKSLDTSGGLLCYGIPGCGKTILASTIVEDLLNKEKDSGRLLLYYYCSYADPRSLATTNILGNILRQLILKSATAIETEHEMLNLFLKEKRMPEDEKLIQLIRSAIERRPGVCIVLDGLDECEHTTNQHIASFLIRLTECESIGVQVLLTCRDESQILESAHEWPRIRLDEAALTDDIRSLVTSSVRSKIENRNMKIAESSLEKEVVTTLVEKAHGMFLWIHFQIIDLCAAMSPGQIRTTLQNLPDGLGETFERILYKIAMNQAQAKYVIKIFHWLACARRPLRAEELQEAVAFDQSDEAWNSEKLPDQHLLIRACQGLVIRDVEDGTVRFAHYSIQQYLVIEGQSSVPRLSPQHPSRPGVHDFQFTMTAAQRYPADICMTYLQFSDFETAIVQRAAQVQFSNSGILGPGGPGAIPSTLGIGKPILEIMHKMFSGRARPSALNIDYTKYLNIRPRAATSPARDKYKLLEYIIANWPWHLDAVTGTKTFEFRSFAHFVANKVLPFEFRPWGPNRHFGPYGCRNCWTDEDESAQPRRLQMTSMMHWVAEKGLVELLKLMECMDDAHMTPTVGIIPPNCLENHYRHERYNNETMIIACQNGRTAVVEYLPPGASSHSGLCMAASASGHAHTLEALFKRGKVNFEEDIHASFFKAAANGHESVLKILLQKGELYPNVGRFAEECNELTGLTPLHSASANGHVGVVCLLAEIYRDIDIKDMRSGSTSLHCAATSGYAQVVTALLFYGASVTIKDDSGMTPLLLAVESGHLAATKCLLKDNSPFDGSGDHLDVIKALKNDVFDIEFLPDQVFQYLSILRHAIKMGHPEMVEILLAYDKTELTAVHFASARGNVDLLKKLIECFAKKDYINT